MHFLHVFYSENVLYMFRTDKLFILRRHFILHMHDTYQFLRMQYKMPPEDEQIVCSKHVQDVFRVKYVKKVNLVGLIT